MPSALFFMAVAALLAAISQVLLKSSARRSYARKVQEVLNPRVILAYGLLFVSMCLNILAFRTMDYKFGPVIASTSYIYVLIFGRFFFGEKLNRSKLIGAGLIVAGVVVFSLS